MVVFAIWLGNNPLSFENLKNITSWKLCGYKNVKIYTEDTQEIKDLRKRFPFLDDLIAQKKYALASDFLRYAIPLYWLQGDDTLYMDVDVTLLRPLTDLIKGYDFCVGKEDTNYYGSAILLSNEQHKFERTVVDYYVNHIDEISQSFNDGIPETTRTSPRIMTELINITKEIKFNLIQDFTVLFPLYPWEFGTSEFSDCTRAIHWNDGSWLDKTKVKFEDTRREIADLYLDFIYDYL